MKSFFGSLFRALKHHKKKAILIFCVFAVLVLTVWYHLPIKVSTTVTALSSDGDSIPVTMNVTFFRFFFKPTEVEGSITVKGTTYVDLQSKGVPLGNVKDRSFFTGIKEKYSGITYFIFSDTAVSKLDALSHQLQILEIDSDTGKIVVHYIDDEGSGYYYLSDKQFRKLKV